VGRLDRPSLATFARFFDGRLPVLLEHAFDVRRSSARAYKPIRSMLRLLQWPASSKWSDVAYLRAAAGDITVTVELGKHYMASNAEVNWRSDSTHPRHPRLP
jgi:hypothetical protein